MRTHLAPLAGTFLATAIGCGFPTGAAAGTFAVSAITGDADSGISTAKTYTHAVDIAGPPGFPGSDPGTVINGVPFTIGSTSGPNYSTTGFTNLFNFHLPNNSLPAGDNTLSDLLEEFYHSSNGVGTGVQTLTLTGLTPGTDYTTTFYNAGFGLVNAPTRVVTVTTSDGTAFTFDENLTGEGNPGVLRYTFRASDPAITYTFTPATVNTFHLYGFTNEVVPEPAGLGVLAMGGLLALRRRARG
jgi:hypothetical protein